MKGPPQSMIVLNQLDKTLCKLALAWGCKCGQKVDDFLECVQFY